MGFLLEDKELKAIFQAFALLMIVMIILSAVVTVIQFAHADGAIAAQDIYAEFDLADIYPWNSSGVSGGFTDGSSNVEDVYRLSYIAFPGDDPTTWQWNVSAVDYEVYRTAGYTCDLETVVYEVVNATDAGVLYGSENKNYANFPGSGWVTQVMSPVVVVPLGEVGVYAGFACDRGLSGLHEINYELQSQSYGAISRSGAGFPDPMTGETGVNTVAYAVRINVEALKEDQTTHNQYYGNATHFVARRDVAVSYPTGSTNRELTITYPTAESFVNITRSNGGAWDQTLGSSDYSISTLNGTHELITIPEATIALYAGDYRVFTQSFPYLYTLYGLYYENGTSAGDTDVTVYFANGTTTTVSVSGTYTLSAANEIDEISWEAGQDARPIAFYQNSGSYYLFTPEDTYGVYQFDINDYSGRVGQGESYLESYRAVNGTWQLVERRQFTGIYNDVPLLMVVYKVYKVQIRFSDGSIYDHGYFYPGVDLSPTIAVTTIAFGDQAHTVYQYITAEATRPNATHIQLDYTDETPGYDTTEANMTITYRNGTQAYSTVVAGADTITFNWYGANNITDYVVRLYITHQLHGSIQQTWVLDYSRIFESFPDLDLFGDMGGLPTANLLAITVGLVLAGACSFKSAALAPFLFMCIQAIFTYLGGASYTETQLGIGIALSIMLGLAIGDRQV